MTAFGESPFENEGVRKYTKNLGTDAERGKGNCVGRGKLRVSSSSAS